MEAELAFVDELKAAAPKDVAKLYESVGTNGSWLTVCPDILGGTLLSRQEFMDNARIRLNLKVLNLPQHCGGCGAGFSVKRALSCKKGGLVFIRHGDVRDEAGALAEMVLPKTRVSYKPFIFHCAGTRVGGAATLVECSSSSSNDARGDVLVHELWKKGEACILDARVTGTDAKFYHGLTSAKVLERTAREKKGQVRKGLFRAAALFYGACLLNRWNGWQRCQGLCMKNGSLVSSQTSGAGSTVLSTDGSRHG